MDTIDLLKYVALIIGAFATLLGTIAIFFPIKMSEGFGIPTTGKASAYVSSLGIRDVFIGLVMLMLYFNNALKMMAYTSFMIASVALVDFIVVYRSGIKKTSVVHLLGMIILIIYGFLIMP